MAKIWAQVRKENELGTIAYGRIESFLGRSVTRQQNMSEETAKKIDLEVKKLLIKVTKEQERYLQTKLMIFIRSQSTLIYETLSGDEIRDLILKDIKPTRSFKQEENDNGKSSSALGSLGLKQTCHLTIND